MALCPVANRPQFPSSFVNGNIALIAILQDFWCFGPEVDLLDHVSTIY